jgi:hypothetical protein
MQHLSYQSLMGRAIWPSAYKCDDVSCAGLRSEQNLPSHKHAEKHPQSTDPKVLQLDEIDIESKEWNVDFLFDELLLGLFKLGDSIEF